MERTKFKTPTTPEYGYSYVVQEEPIIISKATFDLFLKQDNFADIYALYGFYYYTAKWQKTNQPKATNSYVKMRLHWGDDRIRKTKKILQELGLIEILTIRNEEGKIDSWYVKLNFIYSSSFIKTITPEPSEPTSGFQGRNALRANNIISSNTKLTPSKFDIFYQLYPKKSNKGPARESWNKLCRKPDCPTWRDVKKALYAQIKCERWQDPQYIPNPQRWINGMYWENDASTMTRVEDFSSKNKNNNKPKFIIDPDLGKFNLKDDGYYYHCRSGERYIP